MPRILKLPNFSQLSKDNYKEKNQGSGEFKVDFTYLERA